MCVEEVTGQLAGHGSTDHTGPRTQTQVVRTGGKCREDWRQVSLLMSHLSQFFFFTVIIIIYFETGARSVAQAGLEFTM